MIFRNYSRNGLIINTINLSSTDFPSHKKQFFFFANSSHQFLVCRKERHEVYALSTLIIDSPTPTRYKIMTTNHSRRFVLKPQQNKRATLAACTAATVCSFTSTEICHQQTILIFAREKNGKLSGAVCISFWPWEKTIFTIRCLSTLSSQHLPTFFLYFSAKFLLRSFLMLLDIVCPVRWLECVCIVHFWCLLTGLNVSRKYKKKMC